MGQLIITNAEQQIQINTSSMLGEVSNNQVLKDDEIREKLQDMFFKRINETDMVRIMEEHQRMSLGLGILVGIAGKGDLVKVKSLVDEYDNLLDAVVNYAI